VRTFKFTAPLLTFVAILLTGCTQRQQTPEEIRQKTAETTAELKNDTKAVVEGVKQGLHGDKPVDLNKASKDDLLRLPGIDNQRADRIIASRPYGEPEQLVSRHVLTEAQYDKIKDHVVATN
jgi:DNA uptake protein ComE-like DNA-binding protein